MPGGRGTIDQVVDEYLEQVDKVEEKEGLTEVMRVEIVGKIGDMIAAAIEPSYQVLTDGEYSDRD